MLLAAIGDTPYNLVLLVHLVSVILGVGAAFLAPIAEVLARRTGETTAAVDRAVAAVMAPSLLLAGVAGGALVGFSDDVFDFGQTWLAIAGPLWIAAVVLAAFLAPPTYVRLPAVGEQRQAMLGGLLHLVLAVQLVIMIWQPGV